MQENCSAAGRSPPESRRVGIVRDYTGRQHHKSWREDFMHRKFAALSVALGWIFLTCGLVFAHHSVAGNFDQSKTLEVVGKVKEIAIRNPHSQITLEVAKPGGGVTEFFIEWSDKNSLLRRSV